MKVFPLSRKMISIFMCIPKIGSLLCVDRNDIEHLTFLS